MLVNKGKISKELATCVPSKDNKTDHCPRTPVRLKKTRKGLRAIAIYVDRKGIKKLIGRKRRETSKRPKNWKERNKDGEAGEEVLIMSTNQFI